MFDPSDRPRVFGLAPGVDFPSALIEGLSCRLDGSPPQALAQVDLIVNTRRMARRLRDIFDAGPPRLLPRIHLIDSLGALDPSIVLPPATSPLRRRLELTTLVGKLLETSPDLAPRTSLYALSDSLAGLMDEMQGEGITLTDITSLDVSDQSGHWERAQKFIEIACGYLADSAHRPDKETRQRQQ